MSNFDWHTEEEDWDARPEPEPATGRRKRRRWPWLMALLVIVLLASAGGLVGWRIQQQLQQAEDQRTEDIAASFLLVNQAAAEQDSDLLTVVLAANEPEWALAQRDLANMGLLFEPALFAIWRQPDKAQILTVDYESDLRAADVVILETYLVNDDDGSREIQFKRTDQYRRSDRWQRSPPNDDYWQGRANDRWRGRRLTTFFPPRDQALATRLGVDLDALLEILCTGDRNIECPEPLQVQLRFARDPETLLWLDTGDQDSGYFGRQLPYYANGLGLSLPAPSLIGQPVDDPAYQALFRGYARHLVAALMAGLIRQPWSGSQPLYEAALRSQLVELDLLPWPAADENDPLLLPPPEQDIQLICQDDQLEGTVLYRLDLATLSWWPERTDQLFVDLAAAPGGDGVFLQAQSPGSGRPNNQLTWWRDGESTLLFDSSTLASNDDFFDWQIRANDSQMTVLVPGQQSPGLTALLYDLSDCLTESCATRIDYLSGKPLWSPDGNHLLVRNKNTIWHREWNAQRSRTEKVAEGMVPFWLDDLQVGYVRLVDGAQQDVTVTRLREKEDRTIFSVSDLMDHLPIDERPQRLYIGYVDPGPVTGSPWYILALGLLGDGDLGDAYIFSYGPETDQLSLLSRSENLNSFNVSPYGSWLAAATFKLADRRWHFEIHDTIGSESQMLSLARGGQPELPPYYEWSADNQWLLALEQGRLHLFSIEAGPLTAVQQRVLNPPTPGCVQAVWVNRD